MNETNKGMSKSVKIVGVVLVVILVVSVVENFRLYAQVKQLQNPQAAAQNQVREIVANVGRVMELPQNETPTIATVSDLAPLKSQPFFVNAAIGDQVLIYTNARKVILWRPAESKIIEVAPLNINLPTSSGALPTVGSTTPAK